MSTVLPERRSNESGMALIAVLLSLALLTVVGTALAAIGVVEFRTSVNHRSSTRALLLADAGATHALALTRGPLAGYSYSDLLVGADGKGDSADDGYLSGYALAREDALPDTGVMLGVGRYFVRIVNDDADPSGSPYVDLNQRVVAVCRGETADGGMAEVWAILTAPPFPAIAVNGDLHLPGNPNVLGKCAGIHANQTLHVGGHPIVDGTVTATGEIEQSGTIYTSDGVEVEPSYESPVEIPFYDPLQFCDQADFILKDGWLITTGPSPTETDITKGKVSGWSWDKGENTYTVQGKEAIPGTFCAYGNVRVNGNVGSASSPLSLSLLATGSVDFSGTPIVTADHPDDLLIVAGGDVVLGGNTSTDVPQYHGLIYAGAQCQINGTPIIDGRLLCYDGEDPEGAEDLIDDNKINGTPTITYDCTGWRRQTFIDSWWEVRAR